MKLFFSAVALLFALNSLALSPNRYYSNTPASLHLKHKEAKVETADNYKLHSWTLLPKLEVDKNVIIVLAGGDSGNMSYQLPFAEALTQEGYTVVLFDYRGFGQSEDFKMDKSMLYYNEFATDLETIFIHTKKEFPRSKVGIYALSMGTALATNLINTQKVDFLIAEAFVFQPSEMVKRIQKLKGAALKIPTDSEQIITNLEKANCPMFIFSGRLDPITTEADAKKIAKMKKNRTLFIYNGAHADGIDKIGIKNYIAEIKAFETQIPYTKDTFVNQKRS